MLFTFPAKAKINVFQLFCYWRYGKNVSRDRIELHYCRPNGDAHVL